jgi:hypothetical protein
MGVKLLSAVLFVAGLAAAPVPARADISIHIGFPPAWFIATTAPVYYDGHAAYWYQNRWYYQDGRNWRAYDSEPRYLRDYREHHQQSRYHYESQRWDRDHDEHQDHDRGHERDHDRDHDHDHR